MENQYLIMGFMRGNKDRAKDSDVERKLSCNGDSIVYDQFGTKGRGGAEMELRAREKKIKEKNNRAEEGGRAIRERTGKKGKARSGLRRTSRDRELSRGVRGGACGANSRRRGKGEAKATSPG